MVHLKKIIKNIHSSFQFVYSLDNKFYISFKHFTLFVRRINTYNSEVNSEIVICSITNTKHLYLCRSILHCAFRFGSVIVHRCKHFCGKKNLFCFSWNRKRFTLLACKGVVEKQTASTIGPLNWLRAHKWPAHTRHTNTNNFAWTKFGCKVERTFILK